MKIVINIDKKHFYIILALIFIVSGFMAVKAYGTSSPSVFGHTMNETLGLDDNDNGIIDDCEILLQDGNTIIPVSDWVNYTDPNCEACLFVDTPCGFT
ncbi:MAG: hypothetical protein KKH88_00410 [Nanoarchaeota archaeon]|nr:hypothetical protein [Nanoarchaeota archaeon]